MNEVASLLRAYLKLEADAKRLGIRQTFDPDMARLAFARAAEEIEALEMKVSGMETALSVLTKAPA